MLVPSDRTHWKGTRDDTHSSAHSVRLPGEKATACHLEQGASSKQHLSHTFMLAGCSSCEFFI